MIYFSFILGKWNKIHSTEEEYLHLHCNSCCEQRALTPFTKCMCLSSSPFVWTPLKNCGIVARFQNWERTLASDWIENWIHPMVGLSVLQAKERTAIITLLNLALGFAALLQVGLINWWTYFGSVWFENLIRPMVGLSVQRAKERTASITLLKLAWWWLGCTKIRICNLCQKLKSHF